MTLSIFLRFLGLDVMGRTLQCLCDGHGLNAKVEAQGGAGGARIAGAVAYQLADIQKQTRVVPLLKYRKSAELNWKVHKISAARA